MWFNLHINLVHRTLVWYSIKQLKFHDLNDNFYTFENWLHFVFNNTPYNFTTDCNFIRINFYTTNEKRCKVKREWEELEKNGFFAVLSSLFSNCPWNKFKSRSSICSICTFFHHNFVYVCVYKLSEMHSFKYLRAAITWTPI